MFVVVALLAAFVLSHEYRGDTVICGLEIDENAKAGPPVKMPGIDYAALSVKAHEFGRSGRRTYSAGNVDMQFDTGVSQETRTACAFAAELLIMNFDLTLGSGSVDPITVAVTEVDLGTTTRLAQASSNGRAGGGRCETGTVSGFPSVGASSLYRALNNGAACNPSVTDMFVDINSNSGVQWYKGTDGEPSTLQSDMVTVVMHELGHGFGFASGVRSGDSNERENNCNGGSGCSDAFDTSLKRSSAGTTINWNPSASQSFYQSFFTSNDLYQVVDGQFRPTMKVYSLSTFKAGTTGSHWADDIEVPSACTPSSDLDVLLPTSADFLNCNGLMRGSIARGQAIHVLGGNTVAVFANMGYTMRNCSLIENCTVCLQRGCEWCYEDGFCGDRTTGDVQCSDKYQWVSNTEKCSSGNTVCATPDFELPDFEDIKNIGDVIDPQTLTVVCSSSILEYIIV